MKLVYINQYVEYSFISCTKLNMSIASKFGVLQGLYFINILG